MSVSRLLVFFLAFQIEVRVHATGATSLEPIGEPNACWAKSHGSCSVQTGTKPLILRTDDLELWTSGESLLSRSAAFPRWRFLKGSVRGTVSAGQTGRLEFPHGEVESRDGEFWILEDGDRFVIRAVRGEALVRGRDGRTVEVPEGLEIWIGGFTTAGVNARGVPLLIPTEDHLRRWYALERPAKEKFVAQVHDLRERWRGREEVASRLYDQVSRRHLAAAESERRQERAKASAHEQRRAENRRMLLEQAFGR